MQFSFTDEADKMRWDLMRHILMFYTLTCVSAWFPSPRALCTTWNFWFMDGAAETCMLYYRWFMVAFSVIGKTRFTTAWSWSPLICVFLSARVIARALCALVYMCICIYSWAASAAYGRCDIKENISCVSNKKVPVPSERLHTNTHSHKLQLIVHNLWHSGETVHPDSPIKNITELCQI